MRYFITGNLGYIGPLLVRHLRTVDPAAHIIGYDSGFFAHALTNAQSFPETVINEQIFGDVRDIETEMLKGVDAVIHLAAVSNDPMGKRFETITETINQKASLNLAHKAKDAGVKNFVFASSCSVYGAAGEGARKESDSLNPLTAYARSKIGTETGLQDSSLDGMTRTCLRFATACGMTERLRLDLVVNDFVACALTSGEISVLSDGSPWRPLIDVRDMARAIEWAAARPAENGGAYLAVNAGSDVWNYQVKDLAYAVQKAVPTAKVSINTNAQPDKRSYRVDFALFRELAPRHQPLCSLDQSIAYLHEGLTAMNFNIVNFRESPYMRLYSLEQHIKSGRLTEDLRWSHAATCKCKKVAA